MLHKKLDGKISCINCQNQIFQQGNYNSQKENSHWKETCHDSNSTQTSKMHGLSLCYIFLYFMFIPLSCPHFPPVLLLRLVLGPSPIGIASACFWSYLSTKKQSTLHIIEVGGWEGNKSGLCFVYLNFFLQSLIIFHSLYNIPFHFIRF